MVRIPASAKQENGTQRPRERRPVFCFGRRAFERSTISVPGKGKNKGSLKNDHRSLHLVENTKAVSKTNSRKAQNELPTNPGQTHLDGRSVSHESSCP